MHLAFINNTIGSLLIDTFRWELVFVGNTHIGVLIQVSVICLRLELLDCFPKWMHFYRQYMRAPVLPYPHIIGHCVSSWLLLF